MPTLPHTAIPSPESPNPEAGAREAAPSQLAAGDDATLRRYPAAIEAVGPEVFDWTLGSKTPTYVSDIAHRILGSAAGSVDLDLASLNAGCTRPTSRRPRTASAPVSPPGGPAQEFTFTFIVLSGAGVFPFTRG